MPCAGDPFVRPAWETAAESNDLEEAEDCVEKGVEPIAAESIVDPDDEVSRRI